MTHRAQNRNTPRLRNNWGQGLRCHLLPLALQSVYLLYFLCTRNFSSPIHIVKRRPQSVVPRFTFQFKRVAELNKNHYYKFPRETSNDGSFSSDVKEFP